MEHYSVIKSEYTVQLKNIISPVFYSAFQSSYDKVKDNHNSLDLFVQLLDKIDNMTPENITKMAETITKNAGGVIILKLFRSIARVTIAILSNMKLDEIEHDVYNNISFETFVHNCMILSAEQFKCFPGLFYHKLKRHECDANKLRTMTIIKESVEEAIRKSIPLEFTLEKFLKINSEIKTISQVASEKNLQKLENMIDTENKINKNIKNSEIKQMGGDNKHISSHRKSEKGTISINKINNIEESEAYYKLSNKPLDTFGDKNSVVNTEMIIKYTKEGGGNSKDNIKNSNNNDSNKI